MRAIAGANRHIRRYFRAGIVAKQKLGHLETVASDRAELWLMFLSFFLYY
jgi:hypothetical protein